MSSKGSFWRTFSVRSLLVLTALAAGLIAWRVYEYERGTVNDWVDAVLEAGAANPLPNSPSWNPPVLVACPGELPPSSQIQLLMKAVRWLPTSERRNCVLKILAEQFPEEAHDLCLEICRTTKHELLRRNAILLASLYRVERDIDFFEEYLEDSSPEIRSAAVDAIGIIHRPSFPIPMGVDNVSGQVVFDVEPMIDLRLIRGVLLPDSQRTTLGRHQLEWKDKQDRAIAPHVKDKIKQLLLSDPNPTVRSAAARAFRNWLPEKYELRLAEWGVWINEGESLTLAQSIVDEIPPFVHRVGNDMDSIIANRSQSIMVVTKPIIHVSVDQPFVVDISVRIRNGRPWFGFPMPDDFALSGASWSLEPIYNVVHDPVELDFTYLEDVREGYPWAIPAHTRHGSPYLLDVGFRWQTLFVSPEKMDWMKLFPISDVKYSWWERLRQVDCGWVSNRGESERFIYYDGPTRHPSPVVVSHESGDVEVTVPDSVFTSGSVVDPLTRTMILIDVVDGKVSGSTRTNDFTLRKPRVSISDNEFPLTGDDVEQELLDCLTEYGLTLDEAKGLVDCWRPQFFETDGLRLLSIFDKGEYDRLCPMIVKPDPTEFSRVGIVLTELGNNASPNHSGNAP